MSTHNMFLWRNKKNIYTFWLNFFFSGAKNFEPKDFCLYLLEYLSGMIPVSTHICFFFCAEIIISILFFWWGGGGGGGGGGKNNLI